MRYFLASGPRQSVVLTVAGRAFTFEPVGNWGGSWFGVLATDDPSDANILAAGASHQLEEITLEQYEAKKKRLTLSSNDWPGSMRQRPDSPPLQLAVAEVAGRVIAPTFDRNGGPNSTECLTAVTMISTRRQPPAEPILEGAGVRKR